MQSLIADRGMSQRQACIASGIARSTLRYRPVPRDDPGVIDFTQNQMALSPRHESDLLYGSELYQNGYVQGRTVTCVLPTAAELRM